MTKDECYYLGRITKTWGIKGQLVLFMDVDNIEDYAELDSVLVETKHGLVPYFIEDITLNGGKAIATFEDLSPEESTALVGHDLYLPLDLLPKLEGNQFYFHEVVGFKVVDSEHGYIGDIASIVEYPAQPLFQIMQNDTEILIPVIDQVIDKVSRPEKTLYITAPNGLIDLYMDENSKN